jgi:threonine dehydratase
MSFAVRFEDIVQASQRISPYAHRTPIMTCEELNHRCDAELFFKCENFQKVGAFKFRGACNAVLSLTDEEAEKGVVTHSSGNHGQALALAARLRSIPAFIVIPENAPQIKKDAVLGYGADVTYCPPTLEARESYSQAIMEKTGAAMIHPYNDPRVIAGQGTAAMELIEDVPGFDIVLTPVGGGGLLSGTALAVKALSPDTRVIAGEPSGADDAYRSIKDGHILPSENPTTIADGLLTSLGSLTFPIIRELVDEIVLVDEPSIVSAMRLVWERMKIVIEPSSAVPLAVLLDKKIPIEGQKIGVILSGGNVDLGHLPF